MKRKRKIGEIIHKFNYLLNENPIGDVDESFRDKEKHWEHKNHKTFKFIREKKAIVVYKYKTRTCCSKDRKNLTTNFYIQFK